MWVETNLSLLWMSIYIQKFNFIPQLITELLKHTRLIPMNQSASSRTATDIQKINLIPTLFEILLIYQFEVLWTYPTMSNHTHLIFMNQFAASMDAYPYKKITPIPTFFRYYWFIILENSDHAQPYQTTPDWCLWINLLLLWFLSTYRKSISHSNSVLRYCVS